MSRKPSPPQHSLGNLRATETHVLVTPLSSLRKRPALMLISGIDAGKLYPLDKDETLIGRAEGSGIRIDEDGISRRHARVLRGGDGSFAIEDLGSTNGIYRDGARMKHATLAPGDKVQIGHHVVLRFSLVDASEETHAQKLFDLATRDGLTQAYNRSYLTGRLVAGVARAERDRTELGVILFDVDHFKKTNDTYGHIAGDTLLQAIASRVARLIRGEDMLARYGGEEFVVLVPGAPHVDVVRLAERVRSAIAGLHVPFGEQALTVRVSAGVASLHEPGPAAPASQRAVEPEARAEALLGLADKRLYRAKAAGRDRVVAG